MKMSNKCVSIIVPIYNSEKYLTDCLESIINQTYKNLEIILIDDGSTDNSKRICETFVKNDKRVVYIRKTNGGISSARNKGLDICNGQYICFVDSDDMIDKNYIMDFMNCLQKNVDMLSCCFLKFSKNVFSDNIVKNYKKVSYDINNKYKLLLSTSKGYVWNKLYKRDIIIKYNIRFNEKISMCEDLEFNFNYLKYCNYVIYIENQNYFYRVSSNSISKKMNNFKWFSIYDSYNLIFKNFDDYDIDTQKKLIYSYNRFLFEGLSRLKYIDNCGKNDTQKFIYAEIKKQKSKRKKLDIVRKIKLFIYHYFSMYIFDFMKNRNIKKL